MHFTGIMLNVGFPGGVSGKKNPPANSGDGRDAGLIPWSGRYLEKEMATHSSLLPGESHGQRSLADYDPWDPQESDMTEAT